jgi:uncharacterized protein YjiS (DUF1127 family)
MSNHNYAHAGTGPGIGLSESASRLLQKFFKRLSAADDRYRQRRALLAMALDDARLDDIGITRAAAFAEGKMPIWR